MGDRTVAELEEEILQLRNEFEAVQQELEDEKERREEIEEKLARLFPDRRGVMKDGLIVVLAGLLGFTASGPRTAANRTTGGYHWASTYEGGTPDRRLDNALAEAADNDIIYLENETYGVDRIGKNSIAKRVTLFGTDLAAGGDTRITGDWTATERVVLWNVHIRDSVLRIQNRRSGVLHCYLSGSPSDIVVDADEFVGWGLAAGTVAFTPGTSGGVVDTGFAGLNVVDEGSNTVGTIG